MKIINTYLGYSYKLERGIIIYELQNGEYMRQSIYYERGFVDSIEYDKISEEEFQIYLENAKERYNL